MWSSRGFERVLRGVVDQDLCIDLLAGLGGIVSEPTIPYFLWVRTSALVILVISSCPFENVVSWDCPVQITVSNMPGQRYVVVIRPLVKEPLTREVTVHPDESAFPFPDGSGSDHDKLKSHLFEPLYTIQSVWDRNSIVNSGSTVIFLHLALG